MALRALLRKAPALGLGLRSPTAMRALSPAAGSRFMSHGGPVKLTPEQETDIQDEVRQLMAKSDRRHREFLQEMGEIRHRFSQVIRAGIEQDERTKMELKMYMWASNAVIILGVLASLHMLNYF